MKIDEIRVAKGSLSDRIYAGKLAKNNIEWLQKKDITNDFLSAVIERFAGFTEKITSSDGKTYRISVREIKLGDDLCHCGCGKQYEECKKKK